MDNTYTITPEQQDIIVNALNYHISRLYKMAAMYFDNPDAKMDCHNEIKKAKEVLQVFEKKKPLFEVRSLATRHDVGCEAMDAETLAIRLPDLIEKNGSVIVLPYE